MRFALAALALFAVWLVLSGTGALLYVVVGAATALAAATNFLRLGRGPQFRPLAFLGFLPWLAWQVIRSNLRVARVVLSPRMRINPTFVSHPPGTEAPAALTVLGTAITLTPGTLTVDVSDREIFVHALDGASAADVQDGVMGRRLARAFPEMRA